MGKTKPKATAKPAAFLAAVRANMKVSRKLGALTDEELDIVNQGVADVGGNISAASLARLIEEHMGKRVGRSSLVEYLRTWRSANGKA